MHDPLRVGGRERRHDLREHVDRLARRQRHARLQLRREVAPLEPLEQEVGPTIGQAPAAEHARDARVIERPHHVGLRSEPLEDLRHRRKLGGQHLERDPRAVGPPGSVHAGGAAGAGEGLDHEAGGPSRCDWSAIRVGHRVTCMAPSNAGQGCSTVPGPSMTACPMEPVVYTVSQKCCQSGWKSAAVMPVGARFQSLQLRIRRTSSSHSP